MSTIEIVFAIVLIVLSLVISGLVLVQRSKEESLGAAYGDIGGGFEGQRGSSTDMLLSRYTKIATVIFALIVIGADIAIFVFGK